MATNTELFSLYYNSELKNKVIVAIAKKAQTLLAASVPTAAQLNWAKNALENTDSVATALYKYVLAANSTLTVAQIVGASDAAIQSNIDTAADKFIAGGLL